MRRLLAGLAVLGLLACGQSKLETAGGDSTVRGVAGASSHPASLTLGIGA